jgi:hypothetical protein
MTPGWIARSRPRWLRSGRGIEGRMFGFRPSRRDNELRVKPEHFQRECDFVEDALAGGLALGPEFKIIRSVIGSLPISMMRRFAGKKFTSKHFFHDLSMFVHFVLTTDTDTDVASAVNVPVWVAGIDFPVGVTALARTEFLGLVKSEQCPVFHSKAVTFLGNTASLANKCRDWARLYDLRLTRALDRTILLVRPSWTWNVRRAARDAFPRFSHVSSFAIGLAWEFNVIFASVNHNLRQGYTTQSSQS